MKKHIFTIILISLVFIFLYFALDILNFPSGMGIYNGKVNWDIASIVVGNFVVICLYLITFCLFDSRRIKINYNQRAVALLLLEKTYDQCIEFASLFERPDICEKAFAKCNFSKVIHEDNQMTYYLEHPFGFHERIVEFACSGIISQNEFSDYIEVRDLFKNYIITKSILWEQDESSIHTSKKLFQILNSAKSSLIKEK